MEQVSVPQGIGLWFPVVRLLSQIFPSDAVQHLEIRGQQVQSALDYRACSLMIVKSQEHGRKLSTRSPALAETAASATFLVRRTKASDPTEVCTSCFLKF
ncbi:hypothetical protein V6N13_138543 [Hibiscus sabdariffa]